MLSSARQAKVPWLPCMPLGLMANDPLLKVNCTHYTQCMASERRANVSLFAEQRRADELEQSDSAKHVKPKTGRKVTFAVDHAMLELEQEMGADEIEKARTGGSSAQIRESTFGLLAFRRPRGPSRAAPLGHRAPRTPLVRLGLAQVSSCSARAMRDAMAAWSVVSASAMAVQRPKSFMRAACRAKPGTPSECLP